MTTKRRTAAPGVELVPVDALELHPANPRQGDIGAIVESIQANGWWGVVVAQTSTRRVLVGNHRLQAARLVGMDAVPVHWLDVPDDVALRVLLADNRSNDRAAYDDAALADLLSSILADAGTLDGTLFDGDDLDALLADLAPIPTGEASDDAPPLPAEPKTRLGDVFELGPHRLVCGDSTDPDVLARAGFGDATLVFTSPPYGVDLQYATYDDSAAALPALLAGVASALGAVLPADARVCVNFGDVIPGQKLAGVDEPCEYPGALLHWPAWRGAGWLLDTRRVWTKPHATVNAPWCASSDRAATDWEHVWTWRKPGRKASPRNSTSAFGVWAEQPIGPDMRRSTHPGSFPVYLVAYALDVYADRATIVADPFGGTGTTLVAADDAGIAARIVELDPAYCDVIRQRYADHANRPDLAP